MWLRTGLLSLMFVVQSVIGWFVVCAKVWHSLDISSDLFWVFHTYDRFHQCVFNCQFVSHYYFAVFGVV